MAKLSRQDIPFVQIANEVLNDPKLSFKAKGMFAYLFSKPDNWQFESNRIAKESSDGRDSVRNAIKELEQAGYLERKKLPNGRIDYYLKFSVGNPMTENPSKPMTEKPNDGKTHRGKTRPLSNKDKESNKEKRILPSARPEGRAIKVEKITATDQVEGKDIGDSILRFKAVNPTIQNMVMRSNQRGAMARLIKQFGKTGVDAMIDSLPQLIVRPFYPRITTPLELERDIGKLKAAYEQDKNKKNNLGLVKV